MKIKIELHFSGHSPRLLEMTRLLEIGGKGRALVCRCDQMAHPQEASFRWSKGMKTLCLALIRIKLNRKGTVEEPLLSGKAGSAAATFDNLVHKSTGTYWLNGMLSMGGEEDVQTLLNYWFVRQNSQGNNHSRPIRVFARRGVNALMAESVLVSLSGNTAREEELLDLDRELAIELGETPLAHKSLVENACLVNFTG